MNYIQMVLLRQSLLWKGLLSGEMESDPIAQTPEAAASYEKEGGGRSGRQKEAPFTRQATAGQQGLSKIGTNGEDTPASMASPIKTDLSLTASTGAPGMRQETLQEAAETAGTFVPADRDRSAADLSRQIQRDARRYDGGYLLY